MLALSYEYISQVSIGIFDMHHYANTYIHTMRRAHSSRNAPYFTTMQWHETVSKNHTANLTKTLFQIAMLVSCYHISMNHWPNHRPNIQTKSNDLLNLRYSWVNADVISESSGPVIAEASLHDVTHELWDGWIGYSTTSHEYLSDLSVGIRVGTTQ